MYKCFPCFLHQHITGDDGVLEVRVESVYENSEDSMTQAVALSLPSFAVTGFVVYRLYRLNNNGREIGLMHDHRILGKKSKHSLLGTSPCDVHGVLVLGRRRKRTNGFSRR